jgi:hypothetical protein
MLPLTFINTGTHIDFFVLRDVPGSYLFLVIAAWLWVLYSQLSRGLRERGF